MAMISPGLRGVADLDQREVRLSLTVAGRQDEAWKALTCATQTPSWLGRLAGPPLAEGVEFELWHEETVRSLHTVKRWLPPHLLTLTWEFPDETPSTVTFGLTSRGTDTVVAVEHTELDEPVAYAAGWHRHLTYLAAHLSGQDMPWDAFWEGYDDLVEKYQASG